MLAVEALRGIKWAEIYNVPVYLNYLNNAATLMATKKWLFDCFG